MGLMDDIFKDAFNQAAFDPDLMPGVEEITYHVHHGTDKTFNVQVLRDPGQTSNSPGSKSISNQMEIWIQNDAVKGVTAINPRDEVTIARVKGETPARRSISKVFGDSDAGTWHLQIQ